MRSSTELIVLPEAEYDIRDIYQYTRETWPRAQADTYDDFLEHAFHRIQTFPEIGRMAADDDPSIREYALRQHIVIYRHDLDANVMTVLRVVNPRRLRR